MIWGVRVAHVLIGLFLIVGSMILAVIVRKLLRAVGPRLARRLRLPVEEQFFSNLEKPVAAATALVGIYASLYWASTWEAVEDRQLMTPVNALAMIIGSVILSRVVRAFWRNVLVRLAHKTPTKLDVMLITNTERPVGGLVLIGGIYTALHWLSQQPFGEQHVVLISYSMGVCYVLGVLTAAVIIYQALRTIFTWYVDEFTKKAEGPLDERFIPVGEKVGRLVIFFLAILVILRHFDVDVSGLLATAGIASLAVALAAQETLANMIGGFCIMIDRPFRIGDRVEFADGRLGDIQEIGLRTTKILTRENNLLIVPNSEIAKTAIINHSYPTPNYRIRNVIGVAYGSDVQKVKDIVLTVLRSHPKILNSPPPYVVFEEFNDSSLDFLYVCWIANYRARKFIVDQINMEVNRLFNEHGVEIPFPQRDVHLYYETRQEAPKDAPDKIEADFSGMEYREDGESIGSIGGSEE